MAQAETHEATLIRLWQARCGDVREAAGRDLRASWCGSSCVSRWRPHGVGKSSLVQRLLGDGIAWLPTDVLRTVLRRVLPELDELDQGDVPAAAVGELMYPHIAQAVEVCGEEAERFLIEGADIVPLMVPRLAVALPGITIRACFLGNVAFSGHDLASYGGRSRSTRAPRGPSWTPPRRGFAAKASASVASAPDWHCPTSMSAVSASTQR